VNLEAHCQRAALGLGMTRTRRSVRRQLRRSNRDFADVLRRKMALEAEAAALHDTLHELPAHERLTMLLPMIRRIEELTAEAQHAMDQRDELVRQIERIEVGAANANSM